jgi:hypothetical protein
MGSRTKTPLALTAFLAAAAVLAAGASGVLGFWSGSGSGSADAQVDSPVPVTLTPGAPQGQLFPGQRSPVVTIASNPNQTAVFIPELRSDAAAGTNGFAVDPAHSGCDLSALHFDTETNGGAGWMVPPRTGGVDGSLTISMPSSLAMDATAASACQGGTFGIYLEDGQ